MISTVEFRERERVLVLIEPDNVEFLIFVVAELITKLLVRSCLTDLSKYYCTCNILLIMKVVGYQYVR